MTLSKLIEELNAALTPQNANQPVEFVDDRYRYFSPKLVVSDESGVTILTEPLPK